MLLGSITHIDDRHFGVDVLTGSHGGVAVGRAAHAIGVRSLICHDAGVGLDGAGVGALAYLNRFGIPAAAIAHMSARIGDPEDMLARGIVSHVNTAATKYGLIAGMSCADACARLEAAAIPVGQIADRVVVEPAFGRYPLSPETPNGLRAMALDSASSISAEDIGQIVVTGSHGGLPGANPASAIKAKALLAVFNDAGIGADEAGISRLPVLDGMGVAAVCVDAMTAQIGDGLSTYESGVISVANNAAMALGARPGMPVRDLVSTLMASGSRDAPLETGSPKSIHQE